MDKRPIIGLTMDFEEGGGYSKFPWYALRANYFSSVVEAGGLPMALPHECALADLYLDRIDALIVTGGDFDVDPTRYGAETRHPKVTLKPARTDFETAVTEGALDRDMPVLGICGGQQLLNIILGGTLIQHIPDENSGGLKHEQSNPRNEAGHAVRVEPGTLLHDITGADILEVNSAHHQAAKDLGEGVAVNATAKDGIIEGIESVRHRFCLGVQWHPEFSISRGDAKILSALVRAGA